MLLSLQLQYSYINAHYLYTAVNTKVIWKIIASSCFPKHVFDILNILVKVNDLMSFCIWATLRHTSLKCHDSAAEFVRRFILVHITVPKENLPWTAFVAVVYVASA